MTPKFALKIEQDPDSKKWYISPNTFEQQNSFLIECDSNAEAVQLRDDLLSGTLSIPPSSDWNLKKEVESKNSEDREKMGWPTGLEPATTRITIWRSTN